MMFPEVSLDYIIKIRREIHRHPEVAFDLPNTLGIIRRELDSMGIPYDEKYGRSSIVGYINPGCAGKTIALRADTDALPIQEETGLPFASEIPGQMHACGHDCHTAMLLGAAKALKSIENDLKCRVKLVFQAGEEAAPGGGRLMCEDGVVDDVDEALACHIRPVNKNGAIYASAGCINANSHGFKLHLYGKSSHAARPQEGIDAIAMAARVISDIQFMRAREIAPKEPVIINIGEIHGGHANNIVCDHVMLHGTIRTFTDEMDEYVYGRIKDIAGSVTADVGGSYEIETTKLYPALENDKKITDRVIAAAGELFGSENVQGLGRSLGGEDFAFFTKRVPGCMFKLGTLKEGIVPHSVHNGKMDPEESALDRPARLFVKYIIDHMED